MTSFTALVLECLGSFLLVISFLIYSINQSYMIISVFLGGLVIAGAVFFNINSNPCISMGAAMLGKIDLEQMSLYIIVQTLGAVLAYLALKTFGTF